MEVLPRRQDVDYSSARMRNTRPPVQLFWEKRITQLLSQVPPGARGEQLLRSLKLPQCLAERLADPQSPFSSMALDQLTVLQSIIAAIQGLHAASSSSFSSTANAGGAPMSSRSQQHGAAAATSASGNAEQDANCKSDAAAAAQVAIGQQLSADAPGASTRDQSTAAGRPRFHFEYAKQTHHSSNIEYRDIRQPLCPSFTGTLHATCLLAGSRPVEQLFCWCSQCFDATNSTMTRHTSILMRVQWTRRRRQVCCARRVRRARA